MKMTTRQEAEDVKQYVQDQLVAEDWIIDVTVDADDLGSYVDVRVDKQKYQAAATTVPGHINSVRVLTFMIG